MKTNKKRLLALGTLASVATPIVAVVSCGSSDEKEDKSFIDDVKDTVSSAGESIKEGAEDVVDEIKDLLDGDDNEDSNDDNNQGDQGQPIAPAAGLSSDTLRVGYWNILNYSNGAQKTNDIAQMILGSNVSVIGISEINGGSSVDAVVAALNTRSTDTWAAIQSTEAGYFDNEGNGHHGSLVGGQQQVENYAFIYKTNYLTAIPFNDNVIGRIYANPATDNDITSASGDTTGYVRPPYGVEFETVDGHNKLTAVVSHNDSPGDGAQDDGSAGHSQGSQEAWEAQHMDDVMDWFDSIDGDASLIYGGDTNIHTSSRTFDSNSWFQPLIDDGYEALNDGTLETSLGHSQNYSQAYDRVFTKDLTHGTLERYLSPEDYDHVSPDYHISDHSMVYVDVSFGDSIGQVATSGTAPTNSGADTPQPTVDQTTTGTGQDDAIVPYVYPTEIEQAGFEALLAQVASFTTVDDLIAYLNGHNVNAGSGSSNVGALSTRAIEYLFAALQTNPANPAELADEFAKVHQYTGDVLGDGSFDGNNTPEEVYRILTELTLAETQAPVVDDQVVTAPYVYPAEIEQAGFEALMAQVPSFTTVDDLVAYLLGHNVLPGSGQSGVGSISDSAMSQFFQALQDNPANPGVLADNFLTNIHHYSGDNPNDGVFTGNTAGRFASLLSQLTVAETVVVDPSTYVYPSDIDQAAFEALMATMPSISDEEGLRDYMLAHGVTNTSGSMGIGGIATSSFEFLYDAFKTNPSNYGELADAVFNEHSYAHDVQGDGELTGTSAEKYRALLEALTI